MWPFLKKKKPATDPLSPFDAALEQLDRQEAVIRQAASTLLAARAHFQRTRDETETLRAQVAQRLKSAHAAADAHAVFTLTCDQEKLLSRLRECDVELIRSQNDARTLMDAARKMGERKTSLRSERAHAQNEVLLGNAAREAFLSESQWDGQQPALERARDDVERAHAMAQMLRFL